MLFRSLDEAAAAVLLVSPAFLASKYIRHSELPRLLHRYKTEGLPILPVILRPCLFDETTFYYPDPVVGPGQFRLADLQAANPPDRPLEGLPLVQQDEVLVSLARHLIRLIADSSLAEAST